MVPVLSLLTAIGVPEGLWGFCPLRPRWHGGDPRMWGFNFPGEG